jgi:hypothetical protein
LLSVKVALLAGAEMSEMSFNTGICVM